MSPHTLAWDPAAWESSGALKDSFGSQNIINEHLEYIGQSKSTCDTVLLHSAKKSNTSKLHFSLYYFFWETMFQNQYC